MAKKRKSWQEKLHADNGCPRVEQITDRMSQKWGTGTMVIPAPLEVDGYMRSVPAGKLTTINKIREEGKWTEVTLCFKGGKLAHWSEKEEHHYYGWQ